MKKDVKKKIIVGSDAEENEKEAGEEKMEEGGEEVEEENKKAEQDEQQRKEEDEKKRKEEERKKRREEEEQEAEAMSSPRTSRRATLASSAPDQVLKLKFYLI